MKSEIYSIVQKLIKTHSLELEEYELLIKERSPELQSFLQDEACRLRKEIYGTEVYIRGLIEFSNYCKNNCYYCGIRAENTRLHRYRLTEEEILDCCSQGYDLGFRTFVLQSGEDNYFTDEKLCKIVSQIKKKYPNCAITLSVGERTKESYQALFDAGAERYLLRHETASEDHYKKLHPVKMSYTNRINCLAVLRKISYAVGCGFMVNSPFQTEKNLAQDLKFIEEFKPEMCGIGPFIPHKQTPFSIYPAGTASLTCYLISIIRIISPNILLPATTALGTIAPNGREQGLLSGANVVMPNLSPLAVRKDYSLYDNKICTGDESAQCRTCLDKRIQSIGFKTVIDRGDQLR